MRTVAGFRNGKIFALLISVLLVACGNEGNTTSGSSVPEFPGGTSPADTDSPVAAPADLPVDLSELSVRAPSVDEPPIEKPRIQGLATNQGIVELGITNDNTVGFVGQAPGDSRVELYLDGGFIGTAMGRTDGTWVFDYQAVLLPSGAHELGATGVMPDGSRSQADETFTFTYVPDAMAAPVILSLQPDTGSDSADGMTSATEIRLLGTATPNLPVVLYQDGSAVGSADADANGDWVFDYTGTPLADNTYQFSAVTEYAGEISAASAVYSVRIDTGAVAPSVGILNDSSGGSGVSGNPAVVVGGTTEPGSTVEVSRDGTVIGTTVADGSGDWQLTDDNSLLPDGGYVYRAVVTDPAGNVSEVSAPATVTVDTSAPAAPGSLVVSPDSGITGDGITDSGAVTFSGNAEVGSLVRVMINGSVFGSVTADAGGSWSLDLSGASLTDGTYSITATATDPAGNTSAVSSAFSLEIDGQAPDAPVISGISEDTAITGDGVTSDSRLEITGDAEAGSSVLVRLDGLDLGSVSADGTGRWTFDYTGTALPDGFYSLTALATDAAGSTSVVSAPYSVTVDTAIAAPVITGMSDDTATAGDGITGDNTLLFSGTAEGGATVEVSLNGVPQGPLLTADGSGNWTWDNTGSPLAEGNYSVTATAMNLAGAMSPASAALTVTVDQSAPTVLALSPANGATNAALSPSLTVTFDEQVFVSGGQVTIFRSSDGTVLEQIPLTDPRVSGDGTETLTMDVNANLVGDTEYYVQLGGSGLGDQAGNNYAGIADTTSWAFTAEATSIEQMLPDNGATGVSPNSDISIRFSEPVQPGSGNVRVRAVSDNTVFATLPMTDPAVTLIGTDVVSFDIPIMDAGTGYYVELDAGAIENSGGMPYAGFSGTAAWSFDTASGSVATVIGVSSSVLDGAYGTGAVVPVDVTFSEPVNVTGGVPTIDVQLDSGARTLSYVSGSGTATLTFEYVVEYGDASADLGYASATALQLNGSRIRSVSFADSDLTLPLPGSAGSLSLNKDLVISGDSIIADNPGDAGYVMPGNQAGGRLGATLSAVGDLNGDGFEDYAAAAPGIGNGVVYVVWGEGTALPDNIALQPDGSMASADGFRVLGMAPGDGLGVSVGGAGDFNRDGYDDLLIGAPGNDAGGADSGALYLLWGTAGAVRSDLDLSTLSHGVGATNTAGIVIAGFEAGQRLGEGVSVPGNSQLLAVGQDFNSDGVHDLVIGHPGSDLDGADAGRVYVLFGEAVASRANPSLSDPGGDGIILSPGGNAGWQLGESVGFAGDYNGDGYDDLIIGAAGAGNPAVGAGAAYLVFGSGAPAGLALAAMSGSQGFALLSGVEGATLGYSVASGDFNGDGRSDVAVGAPGNEGVYVVYGYDAGLYGDLDVDALSPGQGYRVISGSTGDAFGRALSSAGDFNADGIDDLLVGAYLSDRSGPDAGAVWLLKGSATDRPSWDLSAAASGSFVSIVGGSPGDQFGRSVSAGDFNGDGFTDLVLGAPLADYGASDAGFLLVLTGAGYGTTHTDGLPGTAADELIAGTSGDDAVSGGGGLDVFSTGAGSDIIAVPNPDFRKINAGRGNPLTGMDVLQLGGMGQILDLTVLERGRINNIEMVNLGGGGNALHLDPLSLLAMSRETHQLYVVGDGSDTVSVASGDLWLEDGTETDGTYTYNRYVAGGAELLVDSIVNQSGIATFNGAQRYNLDTTGAGAGVGADVSDFPVLVRITDAGIIDATESDARDIRVMGPDGSLLDYEIERWDQTNNVAELWVRIPLVYGSTDGAVSSDRNFLTLLYDGGPGAADGQNPGGVWSRYSAVWHLDETGSGSAALDSTVYSNNSDVVSGQATSVNGVIGLARTFSSDNAMRAAYSASLDVSGNQPFTVSGWIDQADPGGCLGLLNPNKIDSSNLIYRGTAGAHWALAGYGRNIGCGLTEESFRLNGTTLAGGSFSGWVSGSNPSWILFTAVYDGASLRFYKDGVQIAASAVTSDMENSQDLVFGSQGSVYDEVRYGRHAKSPDEVRLMYQNQRTSGQSLVSPAP